MFGFLRSLISPVGKPLWITGFRLDTPVKLSKKVKTPGGSNLSVINIYVDVRYEMRDRQILIRQVRLSSGTVFQASGNRVNASSPRTGETWFESPSSIPEEVLRKAVEEEVTPADANLRRMMVGKWFGTNAQTIAQPVIDALNARKSAAEIESLIATAGRSHQISFTYESPQRGPERRVVVLRGASGELLKVTDTKDDLGKTFRIDRISNVRFEK